MITAVQDSRLLYCLIREIKTWLNINHIITVITNDTSPSSSTTSFRCPLSQWPSWRLRPISAPQGQRTTSLSGVPSGRGWSQCYIVFQAVSQWHLSLTGQFSVCGTWEEEWLRHVCCRFVVEMELVNVPSTALSCPPEGVHHVCNDDPAKHEYLWECVLLQVCGGEGEYITCGAAEHECVGVLQVLCWYGKYIFYIVMALTKECMCCRFLIVCGSLHSTH